MGVVTSISKLPVAFCGGLSILCAASVLVAMSLAVSARPQASQGQAEGRREAYSREFTAGIRSAGLSAVDTNYFLTPLDGELTAPAAQVPQSPLQALAALPDLQTISSKIVALRSLVNRLDQRFRLRATGPVGVGVAVLQDPEPPPDPVGDSWSLLRGTVALSPIILAPRASAAPRQMNQPRRWRYPVRIAATGDPAIDRIVADVVGDLRRTIPDLPIDERSFPNIPGEANLFLDWSGVQCREKLSCRAFNTWPAVGRAHRIYDPNSPQVAVIRALAFFDQLRSGRWVSRSSIVPLSAYTGEKVTAAWVRTDESGEINTAVCMYVTGVGVEARILRRGEAAPTAEKIRQSVRTCMAAAMGAPSTYPQWSVRSVPLFRDLCCESKDDQDKAYDQIEMLRQLYRQGIT